MKTFTNVLQAHCRNCSSETVAQRFLTFAYWYCPHCKDEVDVKLHTTLTPRGEFYAYSPKEDALTISDAGVYLLTYVNGTYEWYEHHAGTRDLKLHRTLVQSADRLADRDLPSRKQVQPVSNSGEGAENEGLCLRTVSDATNIVQGIAQSMAAAIAKAASDDQQKAYFDAYSRAFPSSKSSGISSTTPKSLWDMGSSDKCVQHGQVPPDDNL